MKTNLEKFVEDIIRDSLKRIKDRPKYIKFVLEELDLYEKKKLWENFKYEVAINISSFYGKRFSKITKIFYGDIASGAWVQIEEQFSERVTGADLDLLIIVSDTSIIHSINKITDELDSYFIRFLRNDQFAAERISNNFLEIHVNDVYAKQAEKDPGSCGANIVYEKKS